MWALGSRSEPVTCSLSFMGIHIRTNRTQRSALLLYSLIYYSKWVFPRCRYAMHNFGITFRCKTWFSATLSATTTSLKCERHSRGSKIPVVTYSVDQSSFPLVHPHKLSKQVRKLVTAQVICQLFLKPFDSLKSIRGVRIATVVLFISFWGTLLLETENLQS
jgi:hypothetical protein